MTKKSGKYSKITFFIIFCPKLPIFQIHFFCHFLIQKKIFGILNQKMTKILSLTQKMRKFRDFCQNFGFWNLNFFVIFGFPSQKNFQKVRSAQNICRVKCFWIMSKIEEKNPEKHTPPKKTGVFFFFFFGGGGGEKICPHKYDFSWALSVFSQFEYSFVVNFSNNYIRKKYISQHWFIFFLNKIIWNWLSRFQCTKYIKLFPTANDHWENLFSKTK